MMKKSLPYLFALVCSMGLFVACCGGGDDPVEVDEDWKNLSKTYPADDNSITLAVSAMPLLGEGRSVEVNAVSAEAATVKLINIVPDGAAISINGVLKKNDGLYSIVSGETTVNDCRIAISGSFDTEGKLTLAVTRTMTTPVTGNWKLLVGEKEFTVPDVPIEPGIAVPYVPVYFNAVTGDAALDDELKGDGVMLGMMIAKSVTAVDVTFSSEGTFNVTWTNVGETTPVGMTSFISEFVKILYTVRDGAVFIALDKSILELLDKFAPVLEEIGISDIGGIIHSIMPLTDGYYVLPISYLQGEPGFENTTVFKLEKAQVINVLEVLVPLLDGDMAGFEQALPLLHEARELEFGLPFVKQ
jgi:hypothetical protein